jgi:hypothetical protein
MSSKKYWSLGREIAKCRNVGKTLRDTVRDYVGNGDVLQFFDLE